MSKKTNITIISNYNKYYNLKVIDNIYVYKV